MGNDYVPCLFRNGVYWGSIKNELKRLKISSWSDIMKKFPSQSETLQFCKELYTRVHAKSQEELKGWIKGDMKVLPRILYEIRTYGYLRLNVKNKVKDIDNNATATEADPEDPEAEPEADPKED
jgi:hypothetical protein